MRLLAILAVSAGLTLGISCSGDGTTLGPDGTPAGDTDGNGDTNGDGNGDGNGDNGDSQPTVTLTELKTDIFTPRCGVTGCHAGGTPSGNMSMEANSIAQEIINVDAASDANFKRIVPGDPENSYIIKKLRGDDGIVGSQMPLSGGSLTDEQIGKIITWIEEGAQDN